MVKQPPPISLRIRSEEASANARRILRGLDEKDRIRRRVKWLAVKALVPIRELRGDAAKLRSGDRDRWQAEIKLVETILLKISKNVCPTRLGNGNG